jgi:hypothetical protein
MVVEREPDCWTRVLSRSAGWRRKAVVQPEPRPARKWKPGRGIVLVNVWKCMRIWRGV